MENSFDESSISRGVSDGTLLPLMEEFYSLQGEGTHTGRPAWFIRIGGCDVGCSWCDVKESWYAGLYPLTATDTIINHARQNPSRCVVVTGGEPLLYPMDYLCEGLQKAGVSTFLETSGSEPLSGSWDWICLSPKRNMPPREEFFSLAGELKVIIHDKHDFEWAEENAAKVNEKCRLLLQPEWSRYHAMIPAIVDYILLNPKWSVSLQAHKFMKIP